jgi:ubiquinone biosynthesis protein COQ9
MAPHSELRERIVDASLSLAEQSPWEAVRLHHVAGALSITLNEVRQHFREKEDVADAWFDRADSAMLELAERADFFALPPRQRLHRLIMTWLGALAGHRQVTRQVIYAKLEPGHVHIQIPGLMRVSRTVQWVREAAGRDVLYMQRALEETVLTSIYLMTFFYWMRDDSADSRDTGVFLERCLAAAEFLPAWMFARPLKAQADTSSRLRTGGA